MTDQAELTVQTTVQNGDMLPACLGGAKDPTQSMGGGHRFVQLITHQSSQSGALLPGKMVIHARSPHLCFAVPYYNICTQQDLAPVKSEKLVCFPNLQLIILGAACASVLCEKRNEHLKVHLKGDFSKVRNCLSGYEWVVRFGKGG